MDQQTKEFAELWQQLDTEGKRAVRRSMKVIVDGGPLKEAMNAFFDENRDRSGLAGLVNAWLDAQGVEG